MSTPYEDSGRTGQKRRTRDLLVAATRELITLGGSAPTVDQAASRAGISRTTAYRYFPSQKSLLVAAHPETQVISYIPDDAGDDPDKRLRGTVEAFIAMIIETEAQQRTMLRLSLEPDPSPSGLPLRQGRAIGWFTGALAPLVPALTEDGVRRLALAIRSAVGIESLVWLTDVAGLNRDQAARMMTWSAMAMLHAAMKSAPPLSQHES
ncbi:MAG: TetR/AcrR family transcriptional regulator [Propionicimonas sp.]